MKLIDVITQKTYRELTDLQRERMLEYYETHSLKECATKWNISEKDGLPQFLSRGKPKLAHGGARSKAKPYQKSEFEVFRDEVMQRLGKDGKALILKLLKMYDER